MKLPVTGCSQEENLQQMSVQWLRQKVKVLAKPFDVFFQMLRLHVMSEKATLHCKNVICRHGHVPHIA